jgi:hypothetical protein
MPLTRSAQTEDASLLYIVLDNVLPLEMVSIILTNGIPATVAQLNGMLIQKCYF